LTEVIFSPGGKGKSDGPLNEHGFGLKNALCVLTQGNKLPWIIKTRDTSAVKLEVMYIINGPFSSSLKVDLGDLNTWNKDLIHVNSEAGTRIYVETSFSFFNTLYHRAKTFDKLTERLIEHLGVIYRKFLSNEYNKMWLRWREIRDDESHFTELDEFRIKPIEIFYDVKGSTKKEITCNGVEGETKIDYITGNLDTEKVKDSSLGKPYPLKIYYQGNIHTQGVDVIIRGRILKTGLLTEIWSDIPKHNDFNKFVGELILKDKKFRTVNNKINLDPHDSYWLSLLKELDDEDYKPQKVTGSKIERDIAKKLKVMLEGHNTGSTVQLNHPIWSGAGVEVDVYHKLNNDNLNIYELKAGTAAPLDAYQLLMYWDGVVKDENKSPKVGRLVAKSIPDSVKNIIIEINKRTDLSGNKYNFETKTIEELGL